MTTQCDWPLCQKSYDPAESDAMNPDLYCSIECECEDGSADR